jgi:hypothetical protein
VLAPIVGPIETTVIVLVVAVFFLLQREDLRDRLIRLFGSTDLHKTTVAMDEACCAPVPILHNAAVAEQRVWARDWHRVVADWGSLGARCGACWQR